MNRTLDENKESDKAEYPARQETDGGTMGTSIRI